MGERDIYGDVENLTDLRDINRQIRDEMRGVRSRDQLTELKKRSDYLCALTLAPSWQKKFGDKATRFLEVAKEEDERTTRLANSVARNKKLGGEYHAWQGG